MRKAFWILVAGGLLVSISLSACGALPLAGSPDPNQPVSSDDPSPMPTAPLNEADYLFDEVNMVDEISINIMESFPLQASVTVRGSLPDGCTEIAESEAKLEDNTFTVLITTRRPKDAMCTQALVPFEENVSLDVYGLPAGTYQVEVYGLTDSFTFDMDNSLPED